MDTEYIAIGPFAWGKANTIQQAVRKMRTQVPRCYVRPGYGYAVYEVGPETFVNELGGLSYPISGPVPKQVLHKDRKEFAK